MIIIVSTLIKIIQSLLSVHEGLVPGLLSEQNPRVLKSFSQTSKSEGFAFSRFNQPWIINSAGFLLVSTHEYKPTDPESWLYCKRFRSSGCALHLKPWMYDIYISCNFESASKFSVIACHEWWNRISTNVFI